MWFKQRYVEPIMTGRKTTTIRRSSERLPDVGDLVYFSVGPRTPFVRAQITARRRLRLTDITQTIARADGFEDASALRRTIIEKYGASAALELLTFKIQR